MRYIPTWSGNRLIESGAGTMNLLARILSHGFAITVVLLLAIGFMYRGELFPEWELPEFLALDSSQEQAGSGTGTVSREDETGAVTEAADTMPEVAPEPGTEPVAEPGASLTDRAAASEVVTPPETAAEAVRTDTSPADSAAASEVMTPPETVVEAVRTDASPADSTAASEAVTLPETAAETAGTDVEASVAGVADNNQAELPDAVAAAGDAVVETDMMETGQADTAVNQELLTETVSDAGMQESAEVQEPAEVPEPAVAEDTPEQQVPAEPARDDMQQQPDAIDRPEAAVQESPESARDVTADSETGAYQLLAAAREAYWLRNYELAEGKYREMIELQPDNPDGYGELGNMYFSQGNWEAAATAYYEAGTRLLGEGLIAQAQQLVDVIRGLNGSRADELARQVDAARESSH
jgi:hypothetical protein